jgi:hypothetical protein
MSADAQGYHTRGRVSPSEVSFPVVVGGRPLLLCSGKATWLEAYSLENPCAMLATEATVYHYRRIVACCQQGLKPEPPRTMLKHLKVAA